MPLFCAYQWISDLIVDKQVEEENHLKKGTFEIS